ncbi:MAG: 1-acyl-sn-glycerol-3-phosphate acyltransferase [Planctomycetota bacterium]
MTATERQEEEPNTGSAGAADRGPAGGPWPSRDALEDPRALGSPVYRAIIRWGSVLVRSHYRVTLRGEPFPREAPVLLVQNHTNGLADAHFPMVATRRPIRILVKYKLMRTPLIGWMLRRMDAVPMYRKKDGVDTRKNADSFESIGRALVDRSVIVLFPEGESLNAIGIRPMKSGVARMVISAETSPEGPIGVQIVPLGVTYEARDRYRSEASGVLGAPIDARPIVESHGEDGRAAMVAIMEEIRASLESLTLHAETDEEYAATIALERILMADEAPLGIRRARARDLLRADVGPETDRRRELVRELGARMERAGLRGDDVVGPTPGPWAVALPVLWAGPAGALGLVTWGLPMLLAERVSRLRRSPDKLVTLRILFCFTGLVVWIPILLALGALLGGGQGVGVAALVVALGLATFTRSVDALRGALRAARLRALHRSTRAADVVEAVRAIRRSFPGKTGTSPMDARP